jgi:hypothetical protein
MKLIILFLCLNSLAFAQDLKITNYLKLQEALASDDFKTALTAHQSLCERDLKEVKIDYKNCGTNFKNMEELRNSFKKLSEVFISKADKKDLKGLMVATCPMAEARWIQKEGSIRNPYYGKSMLECGEKVK